MPLPCATAVTTSPATPRCCPSSAPSTDFQALVARPMPVASGSSPTSSRTTRVTNTRGSRPRDPTPTAPTATSTSGPTPTKYNADVRIIFVDTEESNWTFDPVSAASSSGTLLSHQPDLNYENPVIEATKDVVRFWMDMASTASARRHPLPHRGGGHNGENHPRTHDRPRDPGDGRRRSTPVGSCSPRPTNRRRGRRLLLAATRRLSAVMCFHFPVMPMLYYAPA